MTVARAHDPTRRRLALAGAAALATGCRGSGSKPVVLHFWAMGREGEVVRELLRDFERENPGLRIDVQGLPWTAAHEKLLTAFAGDTTPDLCQLGNTWIPEFAALKALEPLDARVAGSAVAAADYFPGIWQTNLVDGTLYGVPWYVDTRLLFYRRDLLAQAGFNEPPRSWPQWQQMLRAVKRHVGRDRYAIFLPLNEFEPLVALALQQDEPMLRDGGRWGNFRSESFRRTLKFYLSMFEQQLAPPSTNTQIANLWNEFARGYFSFYITGPWNIGEFKRRLPPELQNAWMTAPLPGPNGPGASNAGGSSLVVFRRSRLKEEAWKLIAYLSRPDVQLRFHDLTGNLPPRRSAWSGALAQDVHARAFRDQLERAKPTPKVPEWERVATEIRIVVEHVVKGTMPAERAPEELDARADRILEKRRWLLERSAG